MLPSNTRILENREALAAEACRLIGAAAHDAIGRRQRFRLVLAGGSTPERAYELLAATQQAWQAWEIFWGDERCLPADDPARNSSMAIHAWLRQVPIPREQIHPIAGERGAAEAAAEYAEVIRRRLPFDLVLLGLGEDGHTASLFPGCAPGMTLVIAVDDAPKPPRRRVSLGYAALRACRNQLVLVSGLEKADALAAWRRGDDLPIARTVRADACLLIDQAVGAAAGLRDPLPWEPHG